MYKSVSFLVFLFLFSNIFGQEVMTPELLWNLGRINAIGITKDGKSIVYSVKKFDVSKNEGSTTEFLLSLDGGEAKEIKDGVTLVANKNISPIGNYKLSAKSVKINKVFGKDYYPELEQSEALIYDDLMYRHWDTWEDGEFKHLILHKDNIEIDLMQDEPFNCPTEPFGDDSDYTWSPDGKLIVYVSKKKAGKDYAISTNSDLYSYDVASGQTTNLTKGMMGYDTSPKYSPQGALAWLSMKRDGYEADKNDIIVRSGDIQINLTEAWDGTVNSFLWKENGSGVYFNAPIDGTTQLFEVDYPGKSKKRPTVKQITTGDFDINGLIGVSGEKMIVSRTDMNHAAEIFTVDLTNGEMNQLTHVNDAIYKKIKKSKIEKRTVKTTDQKDMLVWVIYPPDFDPSKKYPTLLYCQGGPQSALSQFYSFRWNFQIMAAQGYIVVAPNRRGMPGHGVAWNEAISKDYGGQAMRDYLSAIDDIAKEPFVDQARLGAVGASFGGYSIFFLAGHHNKRFKTFISHDGIFNMESMYGTTEELFFVNWDNGGAYWEKDNAVAMKTYTDFNPKNFVNNWDTPILIAQGGKDYRVPDGQAFEAFQAAQLKGLKSRLLYFPNENHWVLKAQNGLVWQREFFRWLKETL
ncbi:S9 family peptidase [Namhaeicola litoreus]|uniref:S9 family peptidase n=1 Tax=Namhaeicola litoreus TaxID=1052145 RepID=A0ABW3Y423_9FLAO